MIRLICPSADLLLVAYWEGARPLLGLVTQSFSNPWTRKIARLAQKASACGGH